MTAFFNKPFPYLDHFKVRLLHVLIIMLFSVFFLVIFKPFNIQQVISYPGWMKGMALISMGVILSVIIAVSQLIVRSYVAIEVFRIKHLLVWWLAEVLVVSLMLTIIFSNMQSSFFEEFFLSLRYASIGLVLPYSFSLLILALIIQNKQRAIYEEKGLKSTVELINFKDDRNEIKFSVKKKYILYLESADNYTMIYHLEDDVIQKKLVRTSLKKQENKLSPIGFVRCHRSYMVNMDNVQWLNKDGRNYCLKIKSCETLIPVSRSYTPQFKSLIQH